MSVIRKGKPDTRKISCLEMEVALSSDFNHRKNLIVPNVSYSFFMHELDLCVLTPAGYCTEIEIKVDKYDLIKDKEKPHGHRDHRIKYLYFAIPEYLIDEIHHIPERASIVIVKKSTGPSGFHVSRIRGPKNNSNYKFSEKERVELMRLLCMRIWGLKSKLMEANEKRG